ncbi:MAG: WD40 repeat domain-containing protein, partial [Anaerolineales bacterium]
VHRIDACNARHVPTRKAHAWRLLGPTLSLLLLSFACSLPAARLETATPQPSRPAATDTPTLTQPATTAMPSDTPAPTSESSPLEIIDSSSIRRLSTQQRVAAGEFVRNLAFSPDGTTLAVAFGDDTGVIRLYNTEAYKSIGDLGGHLSIVWDITFSPDGRLLASASKDGTAKIWDWRNGSLVESLALPGEVTSVAFSPDGATLAVGGVEKWPDAAIWLFDVQSWQQVPSLEEFWNIPDIAFSADGLNLVGGGTSRNVGVWSLPDRSQRFRLNHSGQVASIAISSDSSTVVTGLCESSSDQGPQCAQGGIWVWSLQTGKLERTLASFPDWVEAVAFSADGSILLGASRDGTLRAYSFPGLDPILDIHTPGGPAHISILAMAVSPDGRFMATGGSSGVYLWGIGH